MRQKASSGGSRGRGGRRRVVLGKLFNRRLPRRIANTTSLPPARYLAVALMITVIAVSGSLLTLHPSMVQKETIYRDVYIAQYHSFNVSLGSLATGNVVYGNYNMTTNSCNLNITIIDQNQRIFPVKQAVVYYYTNYSLLIWKENLPWIPPYPQNSTYPPLGEIYRIFMFSFKVPHSGNWTLVFYDYDYQKGGFNNIMVGVRSE